MLLAILTAVTVVLGMRMMGALSSRALSYFRRSRQCGCSGACAL